MRGAAAPERRNKAMEVLEMVGLTEWAAYKPDALSGGMQQRVGLARALATDADVLLMDEPFSALDPLIRRDMQDQFLNLEHEMRKTILFITHDLHEALKMGDMLAIMKDGQIDQIGDPEQIISNPATEYVSRFTEDVDRSRVFTVGSIMKPTEALKRSKDGVESAVSRMEALERRALFVVDDAGKPVGAGILRGCTSRILQRRLERESGHQNRLSPRHYRTPRSRMFMTSSPATRRWRWWARTTSFKAL